LFLSSFQVSTCHLSVWLYKRVAAVERSPKARD
jgi:hypothetical protein